MSTREDNKTAGLTLCVLVALVTVSVAGKIGIDLGSMEISMGPEWGPDAGGLPAGEPAPEFTLEDLDGNQVALADQRGKVVLVDFWATWCGPCVQELPHIQEIHERYQEQGLVVLAISTDDGKAAVRSFIEEKGYTFPVLFGKAGVKADYAVQGIPVVYMIDRGGLIRFHHVGFGPGGEKRLADEVERLLEEEVEPPLEEDVAAAEATQG